MKLEVPEGATGYGILFFIWIALAALLAATIAIALMNVRMAVALNFLIATSMALLNLFYFMDLRHEDRFLKTIIFLALFALTSIIILTYSDVFYRMAG
ncbi:MAG: hypothetical protein M0Z52_11145 [Actinomycetota bacterium]|nr:hypothetical protein [Actinomycetota bacterium]